MKIFILICSLVGSSLLLSACSTDQNGRYARDYNTNDSVQNQEISPGPQTTLGPNRLPPPAGTTGHDVHE